MDDRGGRYKWSFALDLFSVLEPRSISYLDILVVISNILDFFLILVERVVLHGDFPRALCEGSCSCDLHRLGLTGVYRPNGLAALRSTRRS